MKQLLGKSGERKCKIRKRTGDTFYKYQKFQAYRSLNIMKYKKRECQFSWIDILV